ncbi:hypothetical protein PsYK624_119100 [Phanerochaete sordida]|uniref:Uncharacterized protein n=1 Tax=Phanerochaete sordida TaxID=48140 RepID=A0A9P3LIJ0_9APHY|nr:hypothetical protein PsYK624_119100 [Phanerochaete sordida]
MRTQAFVLLFAAVAAAAPVLVPQSPVPSATRATGIAPDAGAPVPATRIARLPPPPQSTTDGTAGPAPSTATAPPLTLSDAALANLLTGEGVM